MASLSLESLSLSDDERSQELFTIASIYPDEITLLSPYSASLVLPVTPLSPLTIQFTSSAPLQLRYLPPIKIIFDLPESYPASEPPRIEIKTQPEWIPGNILQGLKKECDQLWEEGMQSVYAVVDHIQQFAEGQFGGNNIVLPEELKEEMMKFDQDAQREVFAKGTYDCGICLEPKKGAQCHALRSCTHVFCKSCLVDWYSGAITEGDVSAVRCSDPVCVKAATRQAAQPDAPPTPPPEGADAPTPPKPSIQPLPPTIPPEELEEIGIPTDLVTRYVALKKKKTLEKDPHTIYCPRKWCQNPSKSSIERVENNMKQNGGGYWLPDFNAVKEKEPIKENNNNNNQEDPASVKLDKLQICSACAFAFCRVCRASWHGNLTICKPHDGTLTEEEIANEKFLKENTTPCPTCNSPTLKSHGCNHMICTCATHFCFLCSAYLDASNPYSHFNTRGSECYQRLWEGEEGDEENIRRLRAAEDQREQEMDNYEIVEPPADAPPPAAAAAQAPVHQEEEIHEAQLIHPLGEEVIMGEDGVVWIDGQPFELVWSDDEDSDDEPENQLALEDAPDQELRPVARRGGRGGAPMRGRGNRRGGQDRGGRGGGRGRGRGGGDGAGADAGGDGQAARGGRRGGPQQVPARGRGRL
ncbi:RWD domain-containing protein [Pyronema omphalodes]|nr:RWD domain-containing protein [Pyronema omphalodes]